MLSAMKFPCPSRKAGCTSRRSRSIVRAQGATSAFGAELTGATIGSSLSEQGCSNTAGCGKGLA
jgi:hypothetical protein